jgi:hypothetical protein
MLRHEIVFLAINNGRLHSQDAIAALSALDSASWLIRAIHFLPASFATNHCRFRHRISTFSFSYTLTFFKCSIIAAICGKCW